MNGDLPQMLVVVTVWCYWIGVLVMMVRSRLHYKAGSGGLPHTPWERWIWVLWLPAVLLWQILPIHALRSNHVFFAVLPGLSGHPAVSVLRWCGAAAAMLSFLLTIPCWLRMGCNWSMAVVPTKPTRLVTDGLFAHIRHPIYALSIVLMVSTMVIVASPAMLIVGCVHLLMLFSKRSRRRSTCGGGTVKTTWTTAVGPDVSCRDVAWWSRIVRTAALRCDRLARKCRRISWRLTIDGHRRQQRNHQDNSLAIHDAFPSSCLCLCRSVPGFL